MIIDKKYTLKDLIYKKYGEEKFAIACEIVSRWIRFETKETAYTPIWVNDVCNAPADSDLDLPYKVALALKQLFGLNSIDDLFATYEIMHHDTH